MTETADHKTGCICVSCEDEAAYLQKTRDRARLVAVAADEALQILRYAETMAAELTADWSYQEFYSDADADADAMAALEDAQRTIRSFARIARERAARTERQP